MPTIRCKLGGGRRALKDQKETPRIVVPAGGKGARRGVVKKVLFKVLGTGGLWLRKGKMGGKHRSRKKRRPKQGPIFISWRGVLV